MHNAASGSHPVDGARLNKLGRTQTVAVHDGTVEQIGHRCQANVRVRPDVMVLARCDSDRPKVVEKKKWADCLPLCGWQQTTDNKAASQILVLPCQLQRDGHGKAMTLMLCNQPRSLDATSATRLP